eukprot:XP_019072308.1 PREDICTED: cytochrome P450 734A2-like [Vitis vinifera]
MYAEVQSKSMSGLQHDILHRVLPYYSNCSGAYRTTFVWWFKTKEVFLNTVVSYDKVGINPPSNLLFGDGLVGLNGEKWALQRRITSQAFNRKRTREEVKNKVWNEFQMFSRRRTVVAEA